MELEAASKERVKELRATLFSLISSLLIVASTDTDVSVAGSTAVEMKKLFLFLILALLLFVK